MSYRGKLASAVAVVLLLLAGAAALWACGPFLESWFLEDEREVLGAPAFWLDEALAPLVAKQAPRHAAVVPKDGPYRQTALAATADEVRRARSSRWFPEVADCAP